MITYPRVFTRQSYSNSSSTYFPISKKKAKKEREKKTPHIVRQASMQFYDTLIPIESISKSFSTSFSDTLTLMESLGYDSLATYALSDTLTPNEQISSSFTYTLSILDTISIQEDLSIPSLLDISFSTLGNTFPIVNAHLEVFPYNYIDPLPYASTNYALMVDSRFNYSATCLFKLSIPYTDIQRSEAQAYFDYWKTNPLTIQIENDIWKGYLTQNNQQLLQRQFSPSSLHTVQIEFEAVRVK